MSDKIKQLVHCFWLPIKIPYLDIGDWRLLSEGSLHIIPSQRCKLSSHIFAIELDHASSSGVRAGKHSHRPQISCKYYFLFRDYLRLELVLDSLSETIALT